MKYVVSAIVLVVIAILLYLVNKQSIYRNSIPYSSVFISKDSVITIAINWQKQYTVVDLHDLKNNRATNVSSGRLIEKCLPIYVNDSAILWTYNMRPNVKWASSSLRDFECKWITEADASKIMNQSAKLFNQPLMSEQNYDPARLPDDIFLADDFQGAQYLVDNCGQQVLYQQKPVLLIQTGEVKEQSVNRFSRFHRHRFISVLVKKYYIALYNEQSKRFDWVVKCDEPNSPHHRTVYFDGVYKATDSEVLLLIDQKIDKLNLEKGTLEKYKELASQQQ